MRIPGAPLHMVRARLHTGDTLQLRHTGHVSAVRGREMREAALSCTAGKQQQINLQQQFPLITQLHNIVAANENAYVPFVWL